LDSKGPYVHLRQRGWLFGLVAMEDIIALEAGTLGRRLSSVPLLSGVDESSLVALEAELEWLSVPGGATLFYEGQIPDALYVVISGCLGVIVRGSDGGEVRVARCQAGDTVGEMGSLGGGRRSATVTALRDTVLLRLEKSSFERLVGRHPLLEAYPVGSGRSICSRRGAGDRPVRLRGLSRLMMSQYPVGSWWVASPSSASKETWR